MANRQGGKSCGSKPTGMVTVMYFGRRREQYFREADDEYIKRIGGYSKIQLVELTQSKLPQEPAEAHIAAALEREAETLRTALGRLPRGTRTVALRIDGDTVRSDCFAELVNDNVCFIIGGSHGLSESVVTDRSISLGRLTLPHELARVVLLEQIYRGFTIRSGGKYHK
ncbi:ribosomal RNA large subunit methyltransferase H [Clostridia bacterium]|nr:ribosomal RNA large subunit methyltransferase H [Clostridia bacterium]